MRIKKIVFFGVFCFSISNSSDQKKYKIDVLTNFIEETKDILNNKEVTQSSNNLSLLKAILMNKQNEIEVLLKYGANPNINYMGRPIIYWAVTNGHLGIALKLINAGADFSEKIEDDQDIFTYVSTHFNFCSPGRNTQLDFDVLNALVENGYDIHANFQNNNLNNNAWYLALINNTSNRVGYFLGWAKRNINNLYPHLNAANPNQIFVLSDGSRYTALLKAIECYGLNGNIPGGTISIILSLLEAGANINQKSFIKNITHSPLSLAFIKNDSYLISQLIEKGADIAEAIKLFIENGGDKNIILKSPWGGNWTLLGIAVYYDNIDAIKILIDKKININQFIDPYPIITARGVLQHIRQNGDFFQGLRGPHTPLFYALHENKKSADYLIQHGAHV